MFKYEILMNYNEMLNKAIHCTDAEIAKIKIWSKFFFEVTQCKTIGKVTM